MQDDETVRESVTQTLARAGCIAAWEEAGELVQAADGNERVLGDLVARRVDGEPVAWLTGSIVFCDAAIVLSPGVYVPRWQTEAMARRAASLLPGGGVGVDLCTGAGAIAAVLAAAEPSARILATEIDPTAARCARSNGIEVFEGFLDEPLPHVYEGAVDVMTAVVPYVPTGSLHLLPRDILAFEPRLALDGGADGTDYLAAAAQRSVRWLRSGGWLLLELGGDQADALGDIFAELGFVDVDVMTDEEGDPRAICGRCG